MPGRWPASPTRAQVKHAEAVRRIAMRDDFAALASHELRNPRDDGAHSEGAGRGATFVVRLSTARTAGGPGYREDGAG